MQILPATGKELKVGDISKTEPNIHGGVKYIRFMIDRYYKDEPIDELNKVLFAFAAYNCGPGRVRQLRREAAARGLDANVWFDNVERIAAEKIGREPSRMALYNATAALVGRAIQRRGQKTSCVESGGAGDAGRGDASRVDIRPRVLTQVECLSVRTIAITRPTSRARSTF
jgi:hypothetical protein